MKTLTQHDQLLVKPYIDAKIKSAMENIASVETSPTANSYSEGEYLIFNDILYVATKAIAVGDTLDSTPTTGNIEESDDLMTMLEALTTRNQAISDEIADMNNVLGAKNILPFDLADIKALNTDGTWASNVYSYRGVNFTINSDGTISATGTATGGNASIKIFVSSSNYEMLGKEVILNGCPSGGGASTYRIQAYRMTSVDGSSGSRFDDGTGTAFTVLNNASGTVGSFSVVVYENATVTNLLFKPMVRLASIIDDTYEPYAKTNKELTDSKYNKTGGTISGDVTVEKTATGYTNAVVDIKQINSDTGLNRIKLSANQEGGNLRMEKAGDAAHMEMDTNSMNGSTGLFRMYLGKSGTAVGKVFKFFEDGSFEDGNSINTKYTMPFMPVFGTTKGRGALGDALGIDSSNVYADANRVGYVYVGYTANIPEDCNTGNREIFYYNSTNVSVKITGRDTYGKYGEWGNNWDGTAWSGWQRLNSKVRLFHGGTANTSQFNSEKNGAVLAYIYDKGSSQRVCNISVIDTYDTWYLWTRDGMFSISLNGGNPTVYDAMGTEITSSFADKGYVITATDANNYVLNIKNFRRVLLFINQAAITLN